MIGFLRDSASTLRETMNPVFERAKRAQGRCYQMLHAGNERFGLPREQWLELAQIALRILAPLAAAFLCLVIFPPLAVKILIVPTVFSAILLSAFYGVSDEKGLEVAIDVHLDESASSNSFEVEGEVEIV